MSKNLANISNFCTATELVFKTTETVENKQIILTHVFDPKVELLKAVENIALSIFNSKDQTNFKN